MTAPTFFRPASTAKLPKLLAPSGDPVHAPAVLGALRADAAREVR